MLDWFYSCNATIAIENESKVVRVSFMISKIKEIFSVFIEFFEGFKFR